MEEKFATVLSEKSGEEAIKEACFKLKFTFSGAIKYIFVFFTSHYQPETILKTINFTLKPLGILGIQTPFLIFEEKIIEKGVVICCVNKKGAELKEFFIKSDESEHVESLLRTSLRDSPGEKFLFSFISHQFNPFHYLKGVEMSLGRIFNVLGGGYVAKYGPKNYQIINNFIGEGLVNIMGKGLEVSSLRIGGFLPIGKPFTITKSLDKRGIIIEIDNQPAINIYKDYFEEKFDTFKKNHLFPLYPLGIEENGGMHVISVIDHLEDGSLVCMGKIKEKKPIHLLLLQPSLLFESLKGVLEPFKKKEEGLVFIINSLVRKKILKEHAQEEIKLIKHHLGNKFKIIGIYSDYSLFPNKEIQEIGLEAGSLLMTLWK